MTPKFQRSVLEAVTTPILELVPSNVVRLKPRVRIVPKQQPETAA